MKFLICFVWFFLAKVQSPPVPDEDNAMSYLEKFGYLEDSSNYRGGASSINSDETVINSLKQFQRFMGLNQTGILDTPTIKIMKSPRCGLKDTLGPGSQSRRKRYIYSGSKWRTNRISYRISKYPSSKLKHQIVDQQVERALRIWSNVTGLNFEKRTRGPVRINIRFERGEHGCPNPFDGPNGTLGHAESPQFGGNVHFDDEENWLIDNPELESEGFDMFTVAAHEFGHSLGLSHSDVTDSLMAPIYHYKQSLQLHDDDVQGIQNLYGRNNQIDPDSEPDEDNLGPASNVTDAPDLCQDAKIDTITRTHNGYTYFFKGDYYWRIIPEGIANGYPRRISEDWKGLESDLDASFIWRNGKTYFFKDEKYWRFSNKRMDPGYPKVIRAGFEGIPDNVDAALVWSGDGKTYFFKGNRYWRYESTKDPPVSNKFPKSIADWDGLPNDLNAAFQWKNGKSYFFKDNEFYKFHDLTFSVDTNNQPYPRPTAPHWFQNKCRRN